jgi:hypothetical protein
LAILTYQLDVVGEQKVAAALASVERRFVQHQARINRVLAMGGGKIRATGGSSVRSESAALRSEQTSTQRAQERTIKLTEQQRKAVRDVARETKAAGAYERAAHREKLRAVERAKREEIAGIKAARRERERELKGANRSFKGALGTGVTGSIGKLAAVGTAGAAMIGVGGSALAAQAVHQTLKLDEQVRRLVIAGRGQGESGLDPEALRKQVVSTGLNTGMAPEQVAAGLQTFVNRTGDLPTAIKNMTTFATVAQATGSSIEDVAGSAADLMQKFDINSVEGMADAFSVLVAQGKKGAFELKDMAANFPEMAAAAQRAGMKGIEGMKTLGGLAQLARTSTGSGAEASTAVQMMLTQIIADSDKLGSGEALGGKKVNIFSGTTKDGRPDATSALRAVPEVLADIISQSGGNLQQLQDVFDVRGIRAVSPMVSRFRDAKAAATAGGASEADATAAGRAAILAQIAESANVQSNYSEIQRDAADVQKATSIKLEVALEELRQAFAEELVPVVTDLAPRVRELVPAIHTVTGALISLGQFLADNPLMGLGAIIGTAVLVEIGKAQIAQAIQGNVISPLGALGLAAGVAASAVAAYAAYLEGKVQEGKQKAKDAAKSGDEVRAQAEKEITENGQLSPETRAKLEQLKITEQSTLAGGDAVIAEGASLGKYGRTVMAALGHDESQARVERDMAWQGAATSEQYRMGAMRTQSLLQSDDEARAEGAKKTIEAAAALKEAAVAIKQVGGLNRGNEPTKPAVK